MPVTTEKGNPLPAMIAETGLSMQEFAERAGVGYTTLRRLCQDAPPHRPHRWILGRIAHALEPFDEGRAKAKFAELLTAFGS